MHITFVERSSISAKNIEFTFYLYQMRKVAMEHHKAFTPPPAESTIPAAVERLISFTRKGDARDTSKS
jgi:hypothetical protein